MWYSKGDVLTFVAVVLYSLVILGTQWRSQTFWMGDDIPKARGEIFELYLNYVSSDNDIKQNNRNNGIADDTGNRRELVHLHGTYT